MTPKQLKDYLIFAINNRFAILIKGKPGIGKTDIVHQATQEAQADILVMHPVVSDPTDFKGLPFGQGGEAHFLPFPELSQLIKATKPLVCFIDDIGQAPASVQAAVMQLLLARKINGHKISDFVTFIAATNRKEDKAAVSGLLEPVKSRFKSIVELEITTDDWVKWAIAEGQPTSLIAFNRFRPDLMDSFTPSRDIVNSPSPRTIASIGHQQNAGLHPSLEFEVFKGAAGEAYAAEYCAFLKMYRDLPNIDTILMDPTHAIVPKEPGTLYALTGLLASKMTPQTIGAITQYLDRLPSEFSVACMKDAVTRKQELTTSREFIKWATDKADLMI